MHISDERPWVTLYDDGVPYEMIPQCKNALEMFKRAVQRHPQRVQLYYFSNPISALEVDAQSDALAVALIDLGLERGDRVALYLQNIPQFALTLLAIWKVGDIMVPINPMLRHRELRFILNDSGARFLVALQSLYHQTVSGLDDLPCLEHVITTSELDYLGSQVPDLLLDAERQPCEQAIDFMNLVKRYEGQKPPPVALSGEEVAILPYTSGTTGPPKGSMNTQSNVVFNCEGLRRWYALEDDDVVFGVAPLFHITGLIVQLGLSLCGPFPLVLTYRFDPVTAANLIEKLKVTYSLGAITAYIAMMNTPSICNDQLQSMRVVVSGGAPIAPAQVVAFRERFGLTLQSGYGLTETTATTHVTPGGQTTPIDPATGALAIGVPFIGVSSRIVDDDGMSLSPGQIGEIAISGPMVVPGYWQKPEETAKTFINGEMRTGDVGFMDEQGWFYIVDRKKDMTISSGYKVWSREVEDVLYMHSAVREAAVVGVAHEYRGESVKAFVSLGVGQSVSERALIEYCREQLAAYKRPREVVIMDELPKTASGKILRRELRGN